VSSPGGRIGSEGGELSGEVGDRHSVGLNLREWRERKKRLEIAVGDRRGRPRRGISWVLGWSI
jgi:hypothetical protein